MIQLLTRYRGYDLENGTWVSPYVKLYTVVGEGSLRVAEVTNFKRARRDIESHVYTKQQRFIVSEADLNIVLESGEWAYIDPTEQIYKEGTIAYRRIGEPLPGSFPEWIEYTVDEVISEIGDRILEVPIADFLQEADIVDERDLVKHEDFPLTWDIRYILFERV